MEQAGRHACMRTRASPLIQHAAQSRPLSERRPGPSGPGVAWQQPPGSASASARPNFLQRALTFGRPLCERAHLYDSELSSAPVFATNSTRTVSADFSQKKLREQFPVVDCLIYFSENWWDLSLPGG